MNKFYFLPLMVVISVQPLELRSRKLPPSEVTFSKVSLGGVVKKKAQKKTAYNPRLVQQPPVPVEELHKETRILVMAVRTKVGKLPAEEYVTEAMQDLSAVKVASIIFKWVQDEKLECSDDDMAGLLQYVFHPRLEGCDAKARVTLNEMISQEVDDSTLGRHLYAIRRAVIDSKKKHLPQEAMNHVDEWMW